MGQGGAATILVVDDDESLRMLCRVNLEIDGYRVLEAATLAQAREALQEPVDVVLLDIHVGREDGLALLHALREEGPTPAVALFTGSSGVEADDRALADAVLPKPFALEELHETVR